MPTRKRTWRAGAAILVTGTTAVVALATSSGHAAAADAYPALAGITTITTSTSGVATVQLKQAATINLGFTFRFGPDGPSKGADGTTRTSIEGNGRILALALEQNGRAIFDEIAVSDCTTAGCQGDQFGFPDVVPRYRKLNPGVYNLYVVADGAPVTATLSLSGIAGSSTVALTPLSGVVEETMPQLIPSTGVADPPLFSSGDQQNVGDLGGIMVGNYVVTSASFAAAYFDACAAQGAPPPVYVAGCDLPPDQKTVDDDQYPVTFCDPRFFCDTIGTEAAATSPFTWWWGRIMHVHPGHSGEWGQGGYFEGAAVLTSDAGAGMWLPFVPAAAPAGSTQQNAPAPTPSASPSPTATATPTPTPTPASGVQGAATNLPNTGRSDDGMTAGGLLAGAMLAFGTAWRVSRRRRSAV